MRTRCRGGLPCALDFNAFKLVKGRGGLPCCFCQDPTVHVNIPHLVRDCEHFKTTRLATWRLAREYASQQHLLGTSCPIIGEDIDPVRRQWWYLLTLGEEVPCEFLSIGLQHWRSAHHKCGRRRGGKEMLDRAIPTATEQRWTEYARLLGITGAFLRQVVSTFNDAILQGAYAPAQGPASSQQPLPPSVSNPTPPSV